MPLVKTYGTGHPEAHTHTLIDRKLFSTKPTRVCSKATITNGDSIGSQYFLAKIPQFAIIHYPSYFYTSQLSGVTVLKLGSSAVDNALGTFDITGGPVHRPLIPLLSGTPTYVDFAWRVLGFTNPPETEIDLIATLGAAATATGDIQLQMQFAGY